MSEAYDLSKMLEEIIEDEKIGMAKNKKVSQVEIRKMLEERIKGARRAKDTKLPLGEALVQGGLITAEQLKQALRVQSKRGGKIGSVLVELGHISDDQLLNFLGKHYGAETTNLLSLDISESLMGLLPSKFILKYNVLPVKVDGRTMDLGMVNPNDLSVVHEVEFLTGKRVRPVVIPSYQMDLAIKYIEGKGAGFFSGTELQSALRGPVTIQSLLASLVASKGSDLFLTAGNPPFLRVDGALRPSTTPAINGDQCVAFAKALMTERQWEDFLRSKEIDLGIEFEDIGRFRVNAYRQKNTVSLTIRRVPQTTFSFELLGLPHWIEEIALRPHGLILITGPTCQGKSATVSAIIDFINRNRQCNIITLEDPIEYVHKPVKGIINQREIGTDTSSFSEGLKRIFRQGPDVIFIGELRGSESFEIALQAALSGHLILSTMIARNTTSAIEGIINQFPAHLQNQVRANLAEIPFLVLSQRLLPHRSGNGLVLAYEKLINSYRIKNFIRENRVHQIRSQIGVEADDYSSIDICLHRLLKEQKITREWALMHAENPEYVAVPDAVRPSASH
jgi:twitching motility protein PilT